MMNRHNIILGLACLVLLVSCKDKPEEAPAEPAAATRTPVTITSIETTSLNDSIELNATSAFLQNYYVKSTANGYIKSVNTKPGEYVNKGKNLFTIQTKESMVIGNSISSLDSSFKFSGLNIIKSTGNGYISQLNHQEGDYIQDGDQLAVISDRNSFVFLLNLPYELRPYVLNKRTVRLVLPDGMNLQGTITEAMPTVDSIAQTQTMIISVKSEAPIPQNLIAKVRIARDSKPNAQTLPRSAILSDETQTNFWVMKMIDSITAVKIPVQKGLGIKQPG